MATHDYNLANLVGSDARIDLNNLFLAIVSQNSSATEPVTTFAHMLWADTTTSILKQRNAGNSGWISLFNMTTGAWLGNAATATTATNATNAVTLSGGTADTVTIAASGFGMRVRQPAGNGSQAILQFVNNEAAVQIGSLAADANKIDINAPAGGYVNIPSGQIKFPATQIPSADPNTLDDYEEGTWTPSVGGTATYTIQAGTYTKVGRLVSFQMRIQINVLGTGSTTTISGLPFVTAALTPCSFLDITNLLATAVVSVSPYISGSNIIILSRVAASTNTSSNAIFTNNTNVYNAGSYEV